MNIDRIIKYRELSDSSIKLYSKYGARLARHLYPNKKEPKICGKDINDNKELIDLFIATLSHHQKKILISTMLVILSPKKKKPMDRWKGVYEYYNTMLKTLHAIYIKERQMNIKNEKEEKHWMEWEDIVLTLLKLKEDYNKKSSAFNFKRYMVLALYCFDSNPPRRLEYCYTKIIKETLYKKLNDTIIKNNVFIVIPKEKEDNMYFSFGVNKVKVKKKVYNESGKQIIPLGDELNEILYEHCKKNIGKYLLPSRDKKNHMTTGALTSFLNRIFNKNISATMLRKIYISFRFRNHIRLYQKTLCGTEREKMAELMGHSADTQINYYLKQ